MGGGFVSDRISNNDGRILGSMLCGMAMLVEEWTGQEGVDLQDRASSIDLFSGFLDPGRRFAFTSKSVHYHHWLGVAYLMDIAATVMSNRCFSTKIFPNLCLHLAVSFLHGFMYCPSQPQHLPVIRKLRPSIIWRLYCCTEPIIFWSCHHLKKMESNTQE
jgi:hypothetical protein